MAGLCELRRDPVKYNYDPTEVKRFDQTADTASDGIRSIPRRRGAALTRSADVSPVKGLVPGWSKEAKLGRLINARAETVTQKPSFRAAAAKRRCVLQQTGTTSGRPPRRGSNRTSCTMTRF